MQSLTILFKSSESDESLSLKDAWSEMSSSLSSDGEFKAVKHIKKGEQGENTEQ